MPLLWHGSLSMNRALMAAGLVDRVRVTIFPSSVVGPARIRSSREWPTRPGAARTRTLDGDIQELVYGPRCAAELRIGSSSG